MATQQHGLGYRSKPHQQQPQKAAAGHQQSSSLGKGDMLDGVGKVRFLMEMSSRLEQDGNVPESIQAAESALLLRRELGDEDQSLFPTSLQRQAQDLVMKCNALGVQGFQKDQFEAATFLLEKALLLTDENPTMHSFSNHEHDRLRLRAATFNNMGCMEKRRGNYDVALKNLQQAAELETLVDPDVGAGPSTYLNMCTILNKKGDFVQAVNAADRSLRASVLQQQQGREINAQFVHLIVMAHYNRGVALEFAGRPGGIAKAHDAYMQAVRTADRFGASNMSPGSESVKDAAIAAIRRLDQQPALAFGLDGSSNRSLGGGGGGGSSPTGSPLSALTGGAGGGLSASQQQSKPMDLATARLLAQLTPLPPPGAIPVVTAAAQQQQGGGDGSAAAAAASSSGGDGQHPSSAPLQPGRLPLDGIPPPGGNKRTFAGSVQGRSSTNNRRDRGGGGGRNAASRHQRKEAYDARLENAMKKAKAAHQKERAERNRKEQEAAVKKREEEAKAMYRRMEASLRNERITKLHSSAIKIQRLWRGYYARDIIRAMAESALRIQAVFRSHRCRIELAHQAQAKEQEDKLAAVHAQKVQACNLIMRPVRRFLRICDTFRKLHALRLQRFHSARKIQRAWRDYRVRCEEEFLNRIAREKKAHEEKVRKHNMAARRIQQLFRAWKSKRIMRIVRLEQQRRNAAATKIQALIRGTLTRVWYRHFIVYRRQQMLSTAASLRKIGKIQAVWRGAIARRLYRRLSTEKRIRDREQLRFVSARRLQCFWRCFVAKARFESLRYRANRRHACATKIQSAWRGMKARVQYKEIRQQDKRLRATRVIQQWYRDMRLRKKQIREARWAAERRAEEKRLLRRTGNAMVIQTWSRWALAREAFQKALDHWRYREGFAMTIERVGRGWLGRKDVATTKRIAWLVDMQTKKSALLNKSARVIQRNARSFLAKTKLENLRREFTLSTFVQSFCRGRRSYKYVMRTLMHNRLEQADTAARRIQKSVRLWIQRKHLLELEKYYLMIRRNKLLQMRRDEAATQIQSLQRGYIARKLAKREKQKNLQRMIDCVTIQRWFRRRRFRRSINAEFARRRVIRAVRFKAAVRLQSFWRRILAEEYVAVIRERKYYKTVAAIVLQCFWRRFRAKRIAKDKRAARAKFQQLCLEQQEALEYGVRLVTACLRARFDGWKVLADRETLLTGQLERRVMSNYLLKNAAATRIQALYRGCYERVYVRGLRREREKQQAVEDDIHARHTAAACCIQRAARCMLARRTYKALLHDKRERELAERLEYEEKADPQSLVQQLFWVQEALTHKNISYERKVRHAKSHSAAIKIQAIARGYIVRRQRARLQFEKRAETVAIIGDSHDLTEQEAMALRHTQEQAATKIEKVARGFVERRRWREYKRQLLVDRQETTADVELRDAAAIRIQSVRRGYVARVRTDALKLSIQREKEAKSRHEAAAMIQRNWRQHNERVKRRQPKLVSGAAPSLAAGVKPEAVGTPQTRGLYIPSPTQSHLDSGNIADTPSTGDAGAAPLPPPRRTLVPRPPSADGSSSVAVPTSSSSSVEQQQHQPTMTSGGNNSNSNVLAPTPPTTDLPVGPGGRPQRNPRSKPV